MKTAFKIGDYVICDGQGCYYLGHKGFIEEIRHGDALIRFSINLTSWLIGKGVNTVASDRVEDDLYWCDPMYFSLISPLELLAECAE